MFSSPFAPFPRGRLRVAPTLLVLVGAPLVMLVATPVGLAFFDGGGLEGEELAGVLREFMKTRLGTLAAVLPQQLAILALALAAAFFSPMPVEERLVLARPRLPGHAVAVMALATPAINFPFLLVLRMIVEQPTEHLEAVGELMSAHQDGFVLVMILLVGVLPGIAEELLFRGYGQSRLVARFGPLAGISISAVLFAAAHGDWMHALAVLPVGLWLGIIAWRSRSTWTAVLGHAIFNTLSLSMTTPLVGLGVMLLLLSILCAPIAIVMLFALRPRAGVTSP